jgi:AraC-like DNA-binding protein
VRFVSLRYGAVRVHLRATPDGMAFEVIERIELGEAREFMMAVLLVTVLELIEALLGHPMTDMQIDLPFAEAQWRTPIERHFRGAMRFNAPRLVFHLKQSWLAQPCITADPPAHDLACLECEKLMSKTVAASMSERVREFLQGREGYYPTLGVAARYFSMSSRTLIRRLKDENTSFQDLLDALRRERAQWYLVHTQHSIEEIAARLGYVDTTNFSRTFRRWFGMTPGEARRLGQA